MESDFSSLRLSLFLLFSALSAACSTAPSVRFERSGLHLRPSRPDSCRFELYLKDPPYDYDKLGVIWFPYTDERKARPRTPDAVMEISRIHVCRAGGNALLLWRPSVEGYYVKGTVVHLHYDFEYEFHEKEKESQDRRD